MCHSDTCWPSPKVARVPGSRSPIARSCRRRPRLPSSWPGVDGQLRRGWGEIDFRLPCACAVLKKDREWANSDKILERSTGPWDRQRGCRSRWIAGPRCPVSSRSLRSCCIQVGGFGVMYDDERRRRRGRRKRSFSFFFFAIKWYLWWSLSFLLIVGMFGFGFLLRMDIRHRWSINRRSKISPVNIWYTDSTEGIVRIVWMFARRPMGLWHPKPHRFPHAPRVICVIPIS